MMRWTVIWAAIWGLLLISTVGRAANQTEEARAMAEIEQLGGEVGICERQPGKPATVFFHGPLAKRAKSQRLMLALRKLVSVRPIAWLQFFNVDVGDAEVKDLAFLKDLEVLSLQYTKVTDTSLAELKKFPHLTLLDLTGTKITDAGLAQLGHMSQLRSLWLKETRVTDAGLAHIKALTGLQSLDISTFYITDAGLKQLRGMKQLDTLGIGGTGVTDAGLENLKGLTNLRSLDLFCAQQITGAGFVHLKELKNLQSLQLTGTNVKDGFVKALHESLPHCYIDRGQPGLKYAFPHQIVLH